MIWWRRCTRVRPRWWYSTKAPTWTFTHAYVVRGAGWISPPRRGAKIFEEVARRAPGIPDVVKDRAPTVDEVLLKHAIVWVELIDPDPAAVEDPGEAVVGTSPPPAILRLCGKELAQRVRLIMTPRKAEQILTAQYEVLRPRYEGHLPGASR